MSSFLSKTTKHLRVHAARCVSSQARRFVHSQVTRQPHRLGEVAHLPTDSPNFHSDVQTALRASFKSYTTNENDNLPLMVTDTGVVLRQLDRWTQNLPRVRPHYAVKCNPCPVIMQQLANQGAGFDCASRAEIETALATGVTPEDIIFANPIKSHRDIEFARSVGVKKMTLDNVYELEKILAIFPEAELVLRLLTDDSGSLMRFGSKFGADSAAVNEILERVKSLDCTLIGVSFHIGSGCFDPLKYDDAIKLCRSVVDKAAALGLPRFSLLDIGGGFPGQATPNQVSPDGTPAFETFAGVIDNALSTYFPQSEWSDLAIISEPGRYFVTASGTLFTMVQGKRRELEADGEAKFLYYVNDGVYGSFNSIMFDHAHPIALPLEEVVVPEHVVQQQQVYVRPQQQQQQQQQQQRMSMQGFSTSAVAKSRTTIFGPTCDSIDKLAEDVELREMHLGEWLVFKDMGAYTSAAASTFNGVPMPIKSFVHSLQDDA